MAKADFKTSTDYEHPYRPLPIRIFNALGKSNSLSTEKLLDCARRKTRLSDFGDDGHLQALEVLVGSINEEARLTPTGQLIQKSRLTSALVQRLRIEALLKKHPEIQDIDLGTVVLVAGLQRSGTTLLHRLLHSHPEIRGVSGVEALEPVPAGDAKRHQTTVRKLRAVLAKHAISYLSPQFAAIHPIDPDEPEEDVMLLDLNFMSQAPEAIMHVPSYSRWLEGQDHTQTYEYFRKVLKVLCWQNPSTNWVLKTPHHMEYLDVFLKVFPDATVVQTHRDPQKTLPSFCSMVAHNRAIFSDRVDPREIARHWTRKTRRMVELTMEVRARANSGQFVDVSYYDLIEDPLAQLRRVHQRAGIDFGDDATRIAEKYVDRNPKNRFGRHTYQLSDFGLDEQTIEENFSSYRAKHEIPFE
ncbi:MAG: sulfotransferase [Gammaproteobacteria bacterium]|nr:sulfotransferase [Gammaproteobacteria bacterium]